MIQRPSESELRRHARVKMGAGSLPQQQPTATAFVRDGSDQCVVCDGSFPEGEAAFAVYFKPDAAVASQPVLMHADCYAAWTDERVWIE